MSESFFVQYKLLFLLPMFSFNRKNIELNKKKLMSVKSYSAKQFSCFAKMVENETDAKRSGNVALNKENNREAILVFSFVIQR